MTKKCALKCHRCQRVGHRVRDCTIPKRKRETVGRAKALEASAPKLTQINQITSVWDEFPEIKKPERPSHVTSVWDDDREEEENWTNIMQEILEQPQQGFSQPTRREKSAPENAETSEDEE